MTLLICNCHHF